MFFDVALSRVASVRSIRLCQTRQRSLLDVVVRKSWNDSVLASSTIRTEGEWVVLLHLWMSHYHVVRWCSAECMDRNVMRGHDCSCKSCRRSRSRIVGLNEAGDVHRVESLDRLLMSILLGPASPGLAWCLCCYCQRAGIVLRRRKTFGGWWFWKSRF
jgi:hypothetical protein